MFCPVCLCVYMLAALALTPLRGVTAQGHGTHSPLVRCVLCVGGGGLVCTRHSPINEVDKDRYRQGANNHVSSAMYLSRQSVAVSQAMCEAIIGGASAHARAQPIRSSKWKSAMDILWYVRFYLEAIGGACRVEGRGFEPRCGTFFSPFLIFFSPFLFFPFLFFSPLVSFFSSPFHYPLQARSATSMLKHFSSNYYAHVIYSAVHVWAQARLYYNYVTVGTRTVEFPHEPCGGSGPCAITNPSFHMHVWQPCVRCSVNHSP